MQILLINANLGEFGHFLPLSERLGTLALRIIFISLLNSTGLAGNQFPSSPPRREAEVHLDSRITKQAVARLPFP